MLKSVRLIALGAIGSLCMAGCGSSISTPTRAATKSSHHSHTPSTTASTSVPLSPSSQKSAPPSPTNVITSTGVQLVKQWATAAGRGEAPGIPFRDGQNLSVMQTAWGNVSGSAAGAGIYYSYTSHAAAFGTNQGEQIFDVRSQSVRVRNITDADIVAALGQPGEVLYAANTTVYLYPARANYQILWVFSGGQGHTSTTVNHVDVVWPQGTINLMAQNVPNPSVQVLHSASQELSFAISDAPSGYRLTELEWLPATASGSLVVNTGLQAAENVRNDATAPVFMAITGGYRLNYTSAMVGESGQIRLIYESPLGAAIIGTSPSMKLIS